MSKISCENETDLNAIGAYRGECPFKEHCKRNLPTEDCELVNTCEALDPTKTQILTVIPSWQVQNLKRES